MKEISKGLLLQNLLNHDMFQKSKSTFFDIFYKKSVAPFSIVFKLGTEKVINCGNWHSIGIQMSIYHNRVKIVSNIA